MPQKPTIFQKLRNVMIGTSNGTIPTKNVTYVLNNRDGNKPIYAFKTKEERDAKLLQLKQEKLLAHQWVKASYDTALQETTDSNLVRLMYLDADRMDMWPEIGAALDIYAEEACLHGSTKIKLLDGTYTVYELYKNKLHNFSAYTVDKDGKCQITTIEKVIDKGIKPIYELTLDDNTVIKCTEDHLWLTVGNEWVMTKNLTENTRLKSIYGELNYLDYAKIDTNLYYHKVKSVKQLETYEHVYDLFNSSVNNSFAVRCEVGHIISHNCTTNKDGKIINVKSSSDRIVAILDDLFTNRLDTHVTSEMIVRSLCKYGNDFMLLNIDKKLGIMGWKELPVHEMIRIDGGILSPNGITVNTSLDNLNPNDTKFLWNGHNDNIPFESWQVAHFRLIKDSIFLPYGASMLQKARRHWKMVSMMEDAMLLYRLERSVERRIFKVNVGLIDEPDVPAFLQEFMNNVKRAPIIDPLTGQMDLRKNFLDVAADYVIPVRNGQDPTTIDTLQSAQNPTSIEDLEFMQKKVLAALRIPRSFLNFDEGQSGKGQNLSLIDIRFCRAINSIQKSFLMELTKIAIIHLYLLGFRDDLTNFSLTMNNPSNQIEQFELDNQSKRIANATSALAEQGGGIPLMSWRRVQKEIMGLTDEEISDMLNEIRLETAIATELQLTSQIIKKTGVFKKVDNIYGEAGAEYDYSQLQADQGMGGMGGGAPMGGGFGGGFGDELGDLGEPGADDMGELGGQEGAQPLEDMGGGQPLMELLNKSFDAYQTLLKKSVPSTTRGAGLLNKALIINENINKTVNSLKEEKAIKLLD